MKSQIYNLKSTILKMKNKSQTCQPHLAQYAILDTHYRVLSTFVERTLQIVPISKNEPNFLHFSPKNDDYTEKRTQFEPKRTQFWPKNKGAKPIRTQSKPNIKLGKLNLSRSLTIK